jgi:uncharacterized protein YPO0396
MAQFKINFSEVSTELDATHDYLPEYLAIHDRIQKESLPEHEGRFKKLLSKSIVNDMAAYYSTLELKYEEIERQVTSLNQSLIAIPYSDSTYVELSVTRSRDTEVREFTAMIKTALKSLQTPKESMDASFQDIRKILDKLKSEERWRLKVTDVRNWADFHVIEHFRLGKADKTETQKNYYSDSAGLSGGQKAKLAFTILASAVAHQYGLHTSRAVDKSFRFIIIDEAFSKSDDKNSRYALELFKNLGLQLIVVTPQDKIHLIEPYVHKVFLTSLDESLNQSKVLAIDLSAVGVVN